MRLLVCFHLKGRYTTHYVDGKNVDAVAFRATFRALGDALVPALPQSTGFGYRIVWETTS